MQTEIVILGLGMYIRHADGVAEGNASVSKSKSKNVARVPLRRAFGGLQEFYPVESRMTFRSGDRMLESEICDKCDHTHKYMQVQLSILYTLASCQHIQKLS